MNKTLPVVYYNHLGERIVVGDVDIQIIGNDNEGYCIVGNMNIFNKDIIAAITETDYNQFSIGSEAHIGPRTIQKDVNLMEFKPFVRKPFTIEAVEVTAENMEKLAEQFSIGKVQPKRGSDEPYIVIDNDKIPNVNRIYIGFFVTRMGNNIRAYSANTFNEQFEEVTS